MTNYDPPSDPYGNEHSCYFCDGPLTYNDWTREWECHADHDATEVVTASVETLCDVTDLKGNHCPETPIHEVEFRGVILHLCDRCYENVQKGAYIAHLVKRAIDKIDEQIEYTMIYGVEGDTISPDDNTPISGE